ncbi:hypothetical protein BSK56_08980 [Paenibacillus borealis]|uniref:DEAD/DEAH box helicase n=1 Tax=Paenibacillus borealis TaxID=160799 RepID=A0ABX3HJ86_PAEBO|nr:DEAD/DEAH box helicase [Paenibacillus borealis]OMD49476.1 hypothetical protein BSK56_08980 [Paenibacillus borealis]
MKDNLYEQAYHHAIFNKILDTMLYNYIVKSFDGISQKIEMNELKKAGWVASILSDSNKDIHKQRAQIFGSLLYLLYSDDVNCNKMSYVIFSRTGNLLATKFLSVLYDSDSKQNPSHIKFKHEFGTVLDFEVGFKRNENIIDLNQESIITTDFQKKLWGSLFGPNHISISAPTSSGKSFIIQSYIKYKFEILEKFNVLYIIPSKALLNQVSEQFRRILNKEIMIKTAFINNQVNYDKPNYDKLMYVLTPERCLNLLNQKNDSFSPDFIFIDEIQNIEDEEGRGVLLEYVLGDLSKIWPKATITTAGPNISNSDVLFSNIFNKECVENETSLSPVFQIKAIVSPNFIGNHLDLKVASLQNKNQRLNISVPVDFNVKQVTNSNSGTFLSKVVKRIADGEQSIIYSPRTDFAEKWALEHLNTLESKASNTLRELIEYLKEEIHPKYYLVKCLEYRVAFHHSKLPELVRKEIESLFDSGEILYLYCTSTLIQGVNLPAKNLFLISPRKRSEKLSPFEFGNLIGRAGRIKDSLYGSIYYVAKDNGDEVLAEKYFSENYQKDVVLASSKSLKKDNFIETELKDRTLDSNKNKSGYTITLLKHKYLSGENELETYLNNKSLDKSQIAMIIDELESQLSNIELPYEVLKLNPSVDPMLQDKLYKNIKEEGIIKWVISPNPNFHKRIRKIDLEKYEFNDLSFYWQFSILCRKINDIFGITKETYFKHNIQKLYIGNISHFGFRWLHNMSYREIIEEDINYYANVREEINAENENDINKRINDVMNIHSKVITFTLVKYFKVLADILAYSLSEEEKEKYKLILSLPVMLELGTMEPIMIQLISSGINRSVALKVFNEFEKVHHYLEMDVIEWLFTKGTTLQMKPIYIKYLRELGYIR